MKTRQRHIGRAHGSARRGVRLKNEHLAAGTGQDEPCCKAVEAGSDDDDIVAQAGSVLS